MAASRDALLRLRGMKEQYVGDINDYRKFALLRRLGDSGRVPIGVCWMLTPPDGRNDGNKTGYLKQPEIWRHYDPELFDGLRAISEHHGPSRIQLVQKNNIIPRTEFFSEYVPTSPTIRSVYISELLDRFRKAQLIFFDPDNGFHVSSVAIGAGASPKYIYRSEVLATYERGHSVLVYQHFPRESHKAFISRAVEELQRLCSRSLVWCFETADVAFLLVVHEAHQETIGRAARKLTNGWDSSFIAAHGPTDTE